jgi:hypothetical protein
MQKHTSGIAGEFYVAAELTKRGMIATITGKNTKDVDILAMNPETSATISIQVKEKGTKVSGFYVNDKVYIRQKQLGIWYVCVDLFDNNKCYIGDVDTVFIGAQKREAEYLSKPKKDGTPRKPSPSLYFVPEWDLLSPDGVPKVNNWEDLPIFK